MIRYRLFRDVLVLMLMLGVKSTPIRDPKFRKDLDEKWFKDTDELDWHKNDGFIGNPQRQSLKEQELLFQH